MRKILSTLFAVLCVPVFAQMQPGPGTGPGANFDNGMEKLFGSTPTFSANMLTSINGPNGPMTVTSKMVFDHENSWTEMNMTNVSGASLPPGAAAQMAAIGMDEVITVTPSDKKNVYMIYPNVHSYVDMAIPASAAASAGNFQMSKTKLGEETVDGHACEKYDVTVTNADQSNDFTVWNATDLNNFPVKIAMNNQGMNVTITFQNVSFAKPSADLFQPPAHFTRYGSMQDLMQSAVMNHGGMPGMPSSSAPPPTQ